MNRRPRIAESARLANHIILESPVRRTAAYLPPDAPMPVRYFEPKPVSQPKPTRTMVQSSKLPGTPA
jgi:hypothetical protein